MKLDLDRVRRNVEKATTDDLLDRATVYRTEMEPEALAIIDAELARRGVSPEQVETHLENRKKSLTRNDGTTMKCSFCWKPAVDQGWDWHRLYGRFRIFPRWFRWCDDHLPESRRALVQSEIENGEPGA